MRETKVACISKCGTYRYYLERTCDEAKPKAVFVMLNPSTADERLDDPTVRKCVGFATRWGLGGIAVVNLFAVRSPKPSVISRYADPVGPENDEWIRRATRSPGDSIFAAWGAHGDLFERRVGEVVGLIGRALRCIRETSTGQPGHPLMLPYSSVPMPWSGPRGGETP